MLFGGGERASSPKSVRSQTDQAAAAASSSLAAKGPPPCEPSNPVLSPPKWNVFDEEAILQAQVYTSDDYAEFKAAKAEGREPQFRNR